MQKTKEDEYLDKWIKDIAPKLKSKLNEQVEKIVGYLDCKNFIDEVDYYQCLNFEDQEKCKNCPANTHRLPK